ncbi:MAG: hypothetical protein RR203_02465 [Synergistaceae bacterium]
MQVDENKGELVMSSGCKVKWEGAKVLSTIEYVAREAIWLMGQDTITQSINDVPVDTGTLRRSGVVTVDAPPNATTVYSEAKESKGKKSESAKDKTAPRTLSKRHPKVVVSYNTPYAIKLHESKEWRPRAYKYTARGNKVAKPAVGTWKWLEKALPKVHKRNNSGFYLRRAKKKVGL